MADKIHDRYGKQLFRKIAGDRFVSSGAEVKVRYQGIPPASIDGVIRGQCAIEIESREDKQIRGAVLDLFLHPLPKKLLVIIPANMNDPRKTKRLCEGIMKILKTAFKRHRQRTKVVLLRGTGHEPHENRDITLIKNAMRELRCLPVRLNEKVEVTTRKRGVIQ